MCFYNDDYDWSVRVQFEGSDFADRLTHCDECGCQIRSGDLVNWIEQWEHEECAHCRGDYCHNDDCTFCHGDDEGDAPCTCGEPESRGETFYYECCDNCERFRDAIKAHELAEGCDEHESQPALSQMFEEVREFDKPTRAQYIRQFLRMFPSYRRTGYLKTIAEFLF